DIPGAIHILSQGQEFYPESAEIRYKTAGFYLMMNNSINARINLIDGLKLDFGKHHLFEKDFPQYAHSNWTRQIISNVKKTSR
ncbi:MAG: hypothetical protein HKN31_15835, partial [Pricia sp.]|nr:hypothetical protein [Pricia sp.]